jgi:hypothetical protein
MQAVLRHRYPLWFERVGDNVQKLIETSLTAVLAIACFVALLSFHSAAQEEQRVNGVYQAQAMGQNTQFGQTFNVTVNIERYSTPEERRVLVEAFQQAGSKGLFNALEKMRSKGRLASDALQQLDSLIGSSRNYWHFCPSG